MKVFLSAKVQRLAASDDPRKVKRAYFAFRKRNGCDQERSYWNMDDPQEAKRNRKSYRRWAWSSANLSSFGDRLPLMLANLLEANLYLAEPRVEVEEWRA